MSRTALLEPADTQLKFGADVIIEIVAGITLEHNIYGGPAVPEATARQWVDAYIAMWVAHKAAGRVGEFTVPSAEVDRVHHRLMAYIRGGRSVYVDLAQDFFGYVPDHTVKGCVADLLPTR